MMRNLFVILMLGTLVACSQVKVTDYSDARPLLEVEQFFTGDLTAHPRMIEGELSPSRTRTGAAMEIVTAQDYRASGKAVHHTTKSWIDDTDTRTSH